MAVTGPTGTLAGRMARPRPSRARGLRASTGCITCRRRRVKCDETRPICGQCSKSSRDCTFTHDDNLIAKDGAQTFSTSANRLSTAEKHSRVGPNVAEADLSIEEVSPGTGLFQQTTFLDESHRSVGEMSNSQTLIQSDTQQLSSTSSTENNRRFLEEENVVIDQQTIDHEFSPLVRTSSFSPGQAPFEWYQVLAQDAFSNFEKHPSLANDPEWNFDPLTLLQKPSHSLSFSSSPPGDRIWLNIDSAPSKALFPSVGSRGMRSTPGFEPWKTVEPIVLEAEELIFFEHFVKVVGPILDLFDPSKHFSYIVPHLAVRNVGLMKSMLSVGAQHLSLHSDGSHLDDHNSLRGPDRITTYKHLATQYYYETLSYLSQAMQYQSYTRGSEILATAMMISTYEMFDGASDDWERHLKGAFWIQRTQDNDGESMGLRRAVWWAWLRQDIWAGFRRNRKPLTIWRPQKPLHSLNADDLACRVLYLLVKAVDYASDEQKQKQSQDYLKRINDGEMLLQALQNWHSALPESFLPFESSVKSQSMFSAIWINPPAHAAAMQIYCFAKILVLLNKPSTGGIEEYHNCQKMLDEAVEMICGIATCSHTSELPSAFVSVQCLFAAGLCVRTKEQQKAVMDLLETFLNHSKWPPKTLINDLQTIWLRI